MNNWTGCKNLLCVRLDNMGDLLMTSPAFTALKQTFNCKVTVLTSSMAKPITPYIPSIDEVIVWDAPWVKSDSSDADKVFQLVDLLKSKKFDGAIIFTVFSQTPFPAAMLLMLANIPKRLAYCRENPYQLLTDWIPDVEPYSFLQHQVKRDLNLVKTIGAHLEDDKIRIKIDHERWNTVANKLHIVGLDVKTPWLVIHPGVSEEKRQYPVALWMETARKIVNALNYNVVVTGSASETSLAQKIADGAGQGIYNLAGKLDLEEFMLLLANTSLVISVNTSTIHIAAATQTKTIVLYALTNPQHLPWKGKGKSLVYSVPSRLQSKNAVLQYLQQNCFKETISLPQPDDIVETAYELLNKTEPPQFPDLIQLNDVPTLQGNSNVLNFQEP